MRDLNNSIDLSSLSAVRNMHHLYKTDKFHSLGRKKQKEPEDMSAIKFKSELTASCVKIVNKGEQ